MTVAEFIKSRLKTLHLTQNQLADLMGISKQNLSNKLNRDNFTSQDLSQIADLLQCQVAFVTSDQTFFINYEKDAEQ